MKNLTTWCLLGLITLFGAAGSHAEGGTADAEKAVMAMEDLWIQSLRTNNPDLIAPHLADTMVTTGPDGALTDKAALLTWAKTAKYTSAQITDVKVTVYGDAAIATGVIVAEGTDPEGKPLGTERWTDTWIKMADGGWKCVAAHNSAIAK